MTHLGFGGVSAGGSVWVREDKGIGRVASKGASGRKGTREGREGMDGEDRSGGGGGGGRVVYKDDGGVGFWIGDFEGVSGKEFREDCYGKG